MAHVLKHPLWEIAPYLLDLEQQGQKGGRFVSPPLHCLGESVDLFTREDRKINRIGRNIK
jgi:hypothetical protein